MKTVSFSKDTTNIFFHITTNCNLNCRHCYINPEQHGKAQLPIATIESWLSAFSDRARRANVIFLGGEPTLHPNLPEAIRYARGMEFASISIDTNGFLFHDILEKVTPRELSCINFSLDGPDRKSNDAIRGKGAFDRCTDGIRKAVSSGFHTGVIYTVSGRNLDMLPEMPPLLEQLGVNRFFIQVIGLRGNAAGQAGARQVTRTDWLEKIPAVAREVSDRGILVSWPKVFLAESDPFECAGLCADNYFIFPNGRVYRCPLCEDFPLHALRFDENRLFPMPKIHENDLFHLDIPEGCVMNKLIQPGNIAYNDSGKPEYRIACCMLKEEISTT